MDYEINFKNSLAAVDKTASDYLKRQLFKKIEKSEKSILGNKECEIIGFEWMFSLLKAKFGETDSQGIKKLTTQLDGLNQLIYQELERGNRDPEGVWGWLSKKRAICRVREETLLIARCLIII